MSLGKVVNCDKCGKLFKSKAGATICQNCRRQIIRDDLKKGSEIVSDKKEVSDEKVL